MTEIICAVIASASTIICAVVAKKSTIESAKVESRAELRRKESLLSLRMIDSTMKLTVVCSNALTGGHNNGNVEAARKSAEDAAEAYRAFMEEITAKEVSK